MSAPVHVMPQPDGADMFEALATSPDPLVRMVAAADGLRQMVPAVDEALAADSPYGRLRRLLVDLAQDPDPWVRATACSSIWLPEEIGQAVADLDGPGRLRAGWVGILTAMGGDCDDMALQVAVAAPAGELVGPRPRCWQIWGALASAKAPIPRMIALLLPVLASAAAEHYGSQAIAEQIAELCVDPDPQVRELALALPPRWPQ